MKYHPIDVSLFIHNRENFIKQMKPDSIAVFHSNDIMPRSADLYHDFRQNPDFFYLTGIDQEEAILILYPDAPQEEMREVLFLQKTNEHMIVWEGQKYTQEEAQQISGISTIYWTNSFHSVFPKIMNQAENCYLNLNEHQSYSNEVPYKDFRFARELKEKYPLHQFRRAAPILSNLRMIKHHYEIETIKKAVDITGKAFNRVAQFIKPGVTEYEIEAEIVHEFLRNRATGAAYSPIIASGKNACTLHYDDKNQQCQDGDVILMDFGAEYANYTADLSRSIPVNGRFTDRQKDVYNSVLKVMKEGIAMLRPGLLIHEYNKEVGKMIETELLRLNLLKSSDIENQNPKKPAYQKYFMHGVTHHLGLDVHDVGDTFSPIKAGMVFTCEPGIYIPEENLGIRIENDILVTDGDPIDLTSNIPVEVEAIEDLMNATVNV